MNYNLSEIRKFVIAALTEDDFLDLCEDHFTSVYQNFTDGQTHRARVRMLVSYAEKQREIPKLLEAIKTINPRVFAEFEPQLIKEDVAAGPVTVGVNEAPKRSLPKLGRSLTPHEKDRYLDYLFHHIKQYFQHALARLELSDKRLTSQFREIHTRKFICIIYVDRQIKCQCKIWVGGIMSSNPIRYIDGGFEIDNDSSFSSWVDIKDSGFGLSLNLPKAIHYGSKKQGDTNLTTDQIAEYFWNKLIIPLSHTS